MTNIMVRQPSGDYMIRHMMRSRAANGDYQLSWDFIGASHFLIVVHPVNFGCDLNQDIVPWLEQNGKALLADRRIAADGAIWNIIQERELRLNNNKYMVKKSALRQGIPYRIVVYPCEINGEDWEIYGISDDTNVKMLPVSILMEVTYKRKGQKQMCMFRARCDVNRLEGVLRYKPSGSRCQFPVSVECMKAARDGWVCVWLPRNDELSITVAPEYRGYYNIRITED